MKRLWFLILAILFFLPIFASAQVTVDVSVTAQVLGEESCNYDGIQNNNETGVDCGGGGCPACDSGGGGGGGAAVIILPGEIIFTGKAYPNALLTILKNGQVAATFFAKDSGLFKKKFTGLAGGAYSFEIFAEDTKGRKSVTLGFTASVLSGMTTTVSGIYISPTISLSSVQVEKGAAIDISGQVFPASEVNVFIASENEIIKKAAAKTNGEWFCELNTAILETGEHQARAKALFENGEQTLFSQTLSFLVLEPGSMVCQGADLNFDGEVNIIDFSILLYFWGQSLPENPCVDINFDGEVNIIDFSIMMYQWTG